MKKIIFSTLFIFFSFVAFCNDMVKVRILAHLKVNSVLFSPDKGSYKVYGDGREIFSMDQKGVLKISVSGDTIEVKSVENNLGKFSSVKIIGMGEDNAFRIKCVDPDRKYRYYQDDLTIFADAASKNLKLVNVVELDKYISGVVEAEAGSRSALEFYKVQAILARTYALNILTKHAAEGFDICDQVHCQAFYGRTKEEEILKAVYMTKGIVVVDHDMNLITAVFHSNSGGQTVNAVDVWGTPTPYLVSVKDSFSVAMPNYKWTRKMAVEDWLDYLKIKHNYPIEDSIAKRNALNFAQVNRKNFIEGKGVKVPLKNIRTDLVLRSTFFSVETKGDTVLLCGKGYGHGIGMCQEGAMKMAKLGYKYPEVIKFYYKNVSLIDKTQLSFFRED
ncbi:MAG: SpoIID/LytB domain-containing protein [Bacteroidia bacterium]|nr:SpoIID/LytB domain-containing protein [Bacteroidia bacterium]